MSTIYRALGSTEEITECEQCGKVDLKGTVILGIMDDDGNIEGEVYVGSVCAAKMVGGRTTGAKIRQQAAGADVRRAEYVRFAQQMLDFFAPFEGKHPIVMGNAYYDANREYFRNHPEADATLEALASLARHRETVATNGLSVLRAS